MPKKKPSKTRKATTAKKICFLVTPIGPDESPERFRVDQWMNRIYLKVLGEKYEVIRADHIDEPGKITDQIIDHLLNAELVIIDYTNHNPNVMYEAAIRHATGKAFIQIAPNDVDAPFDIREWRSIRYNPQDLEHPQKIRSKLRKTLQITEAPDFKSPVLFKKPFDFEQAIIDPEEIARLVTDQLRNQRRPGIVRMFNGGLTNFGGSNVKCPNCGIIEQGLDYSLSYFASRSQSNTYKCESCGTVFEPTKHSNI